MYFSVNHGEWANKVSMQLEECLARGVKVRLMVDSFGLALDQPRNALNNRLLLQDLEEEGVEVCVFDPKGHRLNRMNRMHMKVCAVDDTFAFIGGSNIGDNYLEWSDHNLSVVGSLGPVFHDVYDYIERFTGLASAKRLNLSQLFADDAQVWLTVPKQRRDIRRALLGLILNAEREVSIRSWYFVPDAEIMDALHSQATAGVDVKILLSDKTKIRLVDYANPIIAEELTKAGVGVYRYTARFMHAKAAWNDKGDVLFGSANIDGKALGSNFECSIAVRSQQLAGDLRNAFYSDCNGARLHKAGDFSNRSLTSRTLAQLAKLATPWL